MDPALKPPTDSKVLASLRRCAIVFDLDLGSEHAFRYVDDIFRDGFWCLFRIPGEKKPVAFNEALQWSTEMRGNTDQHRIMSTQRLLHIARLIPIPAIAELFLNDIKSSFPDIDWREPAAPTPVPTPITDIVDPGIKRLLCYALASREAMSLLFNRLKEVWGDDIPEPIMDLYSIGISENDERVLRARDDYIAATEGRLDPVAEVAAILDIFLSRKARTKKES